MVHLYLCLPDRCGQRIHKSKKDRRFYFVQFYTVCLPYSHVFGVRTGQADRGINAPLMVFFILYMYISCCRIIFMNNFHDNFMIHGIRLRVPSYRCVLGCVRMSKKKTDIYFRFFCTYYDLCYRIVPITWFVQKLYGE